MVYRSAFSSNVGKCVLITCFAVLASCTHTATITIEWEKSYKTPGYGISGGKGVQYLDDGCFVVAEFNTELDNSLIITKIDETGRQIWSNVLLKNLDPDTGCQTLMLEKDGDNGFVLFADTIKEEERSALLFATDQSGKEIWHKYLDVYAQTFCIFPESDGIYHFCIPGEIPSQLKEMDDREKMLWLHSEGGEVDTFSYPPYPTMPYYMFDIFLA